MKKIALLAMAIALICPTEAQNRKLLRKIEQLTTQVEALQNKVSELEREKVSRTTPCDPSRDSK